MVRFEYWHEYILADRSTDSTEYNDEHIGQELNKLGKDGWEFVSMTPDWEWDYSTISQGHEYRAADTEFGPSVLTDTYETEAPYSYPANIIGWYFTFKRLAS